MIIINEIIRLENRKGVPVVSSRQISEHFAKEHAKVCRDIKTLLKSQPTKLAIDFFIENEYQSDRGRTYKEYLLTRDGFSLLVMGFTGSKALEWKLKYISAFNKMEEELKSQNNKMLPSTYKEALIQLLDQVEKNELLLAENQVLAPKAEYHDKVLNKDDLLTTTIVAKDLGFKSATKLNVVMYQNGIIYKGANGVWVPYANYEWLIADGYADYRSYKQDNAKPSLQWTEKGRKWIVENFTMWCQKVTY